MHFRRRTGHRLPNDTSTRLTYIFAILITSPFLTESSSLGIDGRSDPGIHSQEIQGYGCFPKPSQKPMPAGSNVRVAMALAHGGSFTKRVSM